MSRPPTAPLPSPRAHLAASLALFDQLAYTAGGVNAYPGASRWRDLLARPRALPASVPAEQNGLKMDGYITRSEHRASWGLACNDRWEGRAFWRVARTFAEISTEDGLTYDVDSVARLRDALGTSSLTLSVGFDTPGHPPRLKLYLQEAVQGTGIATVAQLRTLDPLLPGSRVPAGLPDDRSVGVLTIDLGSDGSRAAKLYLGGADPWALAKEVGAAVPERAEELAGLAAGVEAAELPSGYAYVTLRLGEGAPRVALNPIFDVHRLGFSDPSSLDEAWRGVQRLFRAAGKDPEELAELRAALPALRLVPTAAALERDGTSADVYIAAWPG